MKLSLIIILLSAIISTTLAQAEHVEISNRVYRFLERMENKNVISGYSSFEIPKSRKEIARFLKQIINDSSRISILDKEMLRDLEIEFQYEIYGKVDQSSSLINNNEYNYFSEKQKYLYFLSDAKFNLFINLFSEFEYLHSYQEGTLNNNALTGSVGGIIRGTYDNIIGFYLQGSNGLVSGNYEAALTNKKLAQNFKFTEKPGESFFDDSEGHLAGDFEYVKFNLGRERINLGYGPILLVDDNSPAIDLLGFNINYKFFSYSFFHAKFLDYLVSQQNYFDKFLVYHRIGFNINRHFDFGAGEFILYGRRGIDLSYLNPFVFYKSVEHSNRDRDNSMLFVDFNNNSFPNTKFHFLLLIDDISYGKIGTGWYGNTVMLNGGVLLNDIFELPVDVAADYRRTEPYTFTHRLNYNNFTNMNYSLGSFAIPNSELYQGNLKYRLNYRLEISGGITYIIHGANIISEEGTINFGGDINLGYRETDNQKVTFLDGAREYYRNYFLNFDYEPINQFFLKLYIGFNNISTQTEESHKEFQGLFTLKTVF